MNRQETSGIRNVALIAHGRAGKTSLAEAMLYAAGAIQRKGHVEEGTSVCDHDAEEIKRRISLSASPAPLEWKTCKVNLIDTPGYFDFVGDVLGALRVADGAVTVLCAASGVEVGAELTWEYADAHRLPRVVFVNKMDRENADFDRVVAELQARFGSQIVPVHIPIGRAETFAGLVDLLAMKAFKLVDGAVRETAIPESLAAEVAVKREALVESVAVTDDELTLKYLENESLTEEEIRLGLAVGTKDGSIVPALCGSALRQVGIDQLLDVCASCLPSPDEAKEIGGRDPSGAATAVASDSDGPMVALVFKTMTDPYVGKLSLFRVYSGTLRSDSVIYNPGRESEERVGQLFVVRGKEQIPVSQVPAGDLGAVAKLQDTTTSDTLCDASRPLILDPILFPQPNMTMAIRPKRMGDEEKIGGGLTRLSEEDPSFRFDKSNETAELLVSGIGEMHLEVVVAKLEQKFGVGVELEAPKIPYRETIGMTIQAEYRHKKQSGGRGQFGHVFLELEPMQPGGVFEFVDKIFGGAVPRQYIPAVEKGVRETMAAGVLAGYPVVDVRVTLYDGSYHSVDSSEMAFKLAASMAFKQGFTEANPVLLEPVMNVTVVVPETYMGDVMGDMNKKRGRIMGVEPDGDKQVVRAQAPMSELMRYAIDLRSMTQGRGRFTVEFDHYEEVPGNMADPVIEAAQDRVS